MEPAVLTLSLMPEYLLKPETFCIERVVSIFFDLMLLITWMFSEDWLLQRECCLFEKVEVEASFLLMWEPLNLWMVSN